ncbi:CAP domain-containing protein [Pseudonocardiaceae bacterium YIM PH 21723]|nr:CAP domain-containing protein [Pseudonocardiaceae bacterium YIM PH 21723]
MQLPRLGDLFENAATRTAAIGVIIGLVVGVCGLGVYTAMDGTHIADMFRGGKDPRTIQESPRPKQSSPNDPASEGDLPWLPDSSAPPSSSAPAETPAPPSEGGPATSVDPADDAAPLPPQPQRPQQQQPAPQRPAPPQGPPPAGPGAPPPPRPQPPKPQPQPPQSQPPAPPTQSRPPAPPPTQAPSSKPPAPPSSSQSQPSSAPKPAPPASQEQRAQLYSSINDARQDQGCKPLQIDEKLQAAAQQHSDEMAQSKNYSHLGPDGKSPQQRGREKGILDKIAESLLKGQETAAAAFKGLFDNEKHRAVMLDCQWTKMGIGLNTNGYYWTVNYSAPDGTATSAAAAPRR